MDRLRREVTSGPRDAGPFLFHLSRSLFSRDTAATLSFRNTRSQRCAFIPEAGAGQCDFGAAYRCRTVRFRSDHRHPMAQEAEMLWRRELLHLFRRQHLCQLSIHGGRREDWDSRKYSAPTGNFVFSTINARSG